MNSKRRTILLTILISYILIAVIWMITYLYTESKPVINAQPERFPSDNSYNQTLKVVMDKDNAPYSYFDSKDEFVGLDVDLANRLGNRLYMNVEILPMEWPEALEAVQNGDADLIMSYSDKAFSPTKDILPTLSIYNNPFAIFGNRNVKDTDIDFKKGIFGIVKGCQSDFIKDFDLIPRAKVYDTNTSLFDALKNGEIDYAVLRKNTGHFIIVDENLFKYTSILEVESDRVCIGVAKGNNKLRLAINAELEELIKENSIVKLEEKWIPDRLLYSSLLGSGKGAAVFYGFFISIILGLTGIIYLVIKSAAHSSDLEYKFKQIQIYKDSINENAVAYFEANLTKDVITSDIIERIAGEYVNVTGRINLPNPMRFTDYTEYLISNKILTDRESFVRDFNRLNLIRSDDEGNRMHELQFRSYMFDGTKKWIKMMIFTSRENAHKDVNAVFVLHDITAEHANLDKQRLRDSALLGMSRDFESVSYVDMVTDEETIYYISPLFREIIGKQRRNSKFREKLTFFLNKIVVPEERERFTHDTTRSVILEMLNDMDSYIVHTVFDIKGEKLFYELKFVTDKDNPNGLIFGTRNIDFETRQEIELQKDMLQNSNIINILASEYSSVLYLDPETGDISSYQLSPKYKDTIGNLLNRTKRYTDIIRTFINNYVCEDDREDFADRVALSNMLEQLSEKKSMSIVYRVVDENGDLRYNELKVVKIDDEKEYPTGLALAFADRDDEICNKYITEKMMEEYDALFMVDLEHGTFRTIKASDNFDADSLASGDYSKAMRLFSYQLRSEYFDVWINLSMPHNMQKYLENDDRREFIFRMPSVINSWRRAIVQVVERKEGVATEIVASFMGIDSARAEMLDSSLKAEDQKKALEERQAILEEARSNAEHANKAKSSFLFNMSHDIRTPMNAIQGFTNIAMKNMNDSSKVSECLEKISISSKHLLDLINDVLDMARIESGKVVLTETRYNIIKQNEEIVTMIKEMAKDKSIDMELNFDGITNEEVLADPLRMNQVFINLLSNAVKYTNPGGKVIYNIKQVKCDEEGYGAFSFAIIDNGIGMTEDYVKHIFEAFTREKNSTTSGVQGTGLGMAITKQLLDLMGGDIRIETKLGEGTKVYVDIKLKLVDYSFSPVSLEDTAVEIDLKGRRVLLVEDNEFNREIARDILEDEGIIVEEAEDGSIAVETLKNVDADHFDFILMDIQMPILDGYEATKQIRVFEDEKKASIPIIAMTANAFDDDKLRAKDAGMNAFVSKPINISLLLQTLQSFANKKDKS